MTNVQSAEQVVATAIEIIDNLAVGEEFKLRDLFSEELWKSYPKGARIAAGSLFKQRANTMPNLQSLGRNAENHQRYRKL